MAVSFDDSCFVLRCRYGCFVLLCRRFGFRNMWICGRSQVFFCLDFVDRGGLMSNNRSRIKFERFGAASSVFAGVASGSERASCRCILWCSARRLKEPTHLKRNKSFDIDTAFRMHTFGLMKCPFSFIAADSSTFLISLSNHSELWNSSASSGSSCRSCSAIPIFFLFYQSI